jgi:hypothetical protein
VSIAGLSRATVPAPIRRYDSETFAQEKKHLRVPIIRRQRPAVTEHDRLPAAPIFIKDVDVGSLFFSDCDVWHVPFSFLFFLLNLSLFPEFYLQHFRNISRRWFMGLAFIPRWRTGARNGCASQSVRQECAQPALRLICPAQRVLLEQMNKKTLDDILRAGRRISGSPDERIKGRPVRFAKSGERVPGHFVSFGLVRQQHDRPMRRLERRTPLLQRSRHRLRSSTMGKANALTNNFVSFCLNLSVSDIHFFQ